MNSNLKVVISLVLVIMWMIVIFILSSMPGESSNGKSKKLLEKTITKTEIIEKNELTEEKMYHDENSLFNKVHYFFRKGGHFTEYLILTLLLLNYLRFYNLDKNKMILLSLLICFIYSCTDEIHQIFVPNRTSLFTDCLIDTTGGLLGCCIYLVINFIKDKIKNK